MIRGTFSLVDMIKNTNFSSSPNVFKISVVWQLNIHTKHQNAFKPTYHLQNRENCRFLL